MLKPKSFRPNREVAGAKKFNPNSHIDALYKGEWEQYSKDFLKHNPNCYACGRKSEAVDHIQAHKGDLELFWKTDNFLPLCHSCHNRVTTLFDRNKIQKLNEKMRWIAGSRSRNGLTGSVKVVPRRR